MRETRESSNGRNGLCRHTNRGERERMTLFIFLDLCKGKRQEKMAYYLFFFFFDKLVLFYYKLIILMPYFRGLKFLWKKKIGDLFFKN